MQLTINDVTRIATEAADEVSRDLQVVGVNLSGGSSYAELLVSIRGCSAEPCQVAVGVFRDIPEPSLRAEIVGTLRRHVAQHRDAAS